MKKIVVLGAGRVGKAIAIDLNKNHQVVSVDINDKELEYLIDIHKIEAVHSNLSNPANIRYLIKDADLVISAVPGFMGYETLKTIIESGKNVVDIAFFPEDPFELDDLAKKHNVTAIVDCGVAPGMGNIILGHYHKKIEVQKYECLVGGLPVERVWPYQYKAVFSPIDVIEEYIRPARYVQNGQIFVREALSDAELINFPGVGTLESWNSDGLRTILRTINVPDMIEKTLRYPGAIEYLRVLRESGFFSYDEVDVKGVKIRPIDLTSELLFPIWQLKEGEEDYTIMRIKIEGIENGKKIGYQYDLLDRYDHATKTISMARTTGYTCTAAANLLLENLYSQKGIIPPEYIGVEASNYQFILDYLKDRNVIYNRSAF
ncbi:MAG: saccharopine dehydrogenase C-terminal domain-containing protein [Bacteroidales bacterium]|nr:saccharopine dehydrogenase C-terminal domain-containing protein [Bacteroidales bacterium]